MIPWLLACWLALVLILLYFRVTRDPLWKELNKR